MIRLKTDWTTYNLRISEAEQLEAEQRYHSAARAYGSAASFARDGSTEYFSALDRREAAHRKDVERKADAETGGDFLALLID